MNQDELVLQTQDSEIEEALRNKDRVYIAGVKYQVDGYTVTDDPETDDDVVTAKLVRVFKNNLVRCPKEDCTGERIKVEDNRYASGHRWECNRCDWGRE